MNTILSRKEPCIKGSFFASGLSCIFQHLPMTKNVKHANMELVKENITESRKRNPAAAQLHCWESLHLKKYILVLQSDVRCVIIEKTEQTF